MGESTSARQNRPIWCAPVDVKPTSGLCNHVSPQRHGSLVAERSAAAFRRRTCIGRLWPASQGEFRSASQFLSRSTTGCLYRYAIYHDREITGEIGWIGVRRKIFFCFGTFQPIPNDALADFSAPNELLTDRIRLRCASKGALDSKASRRISVVAVQIGSALQ